MGSAGASQDASHTCDFFECHRPSIDVFITQLATWCSMEQTTPIGTPPFRVVPPAPELNPSVIRNADALRELRSRYTLDEISELTGMAAGTIQAWSRRLGLTTERSLEAKHANDPAWLRARYIDDNLTAGQIAAELGRSADGIRKALSRHGIRKQS